MAGQILVARALRFTAFFALSAACLRQRQRADKCRGEHAMTQSSAGSLPAREHNVDQHRPGASRADDAGRPQPRARSFGDIRAPDRDDAGAHRRRRPGARGRGRAYAQRFGARHRRLARGARRPSGWNKRRPARPTKRPCSRPSPNLKRQASKRAWRSACAWAKPTKRRGAKPWPRHGRSLSALDSG